MKRRRRDEALRRRKGEISRQQAFELLTCCAAETRHFWDEADRRAAWEEHRDALLAACRAGHRPSAWWEYDRQPDERPRPGEHEVEALIRIGAATAADVDDLREALRYGLEVPELARRLNIDVRRVRQAIAAFDARN